ncbi:hypothetical protein RM572_12285 [Streptomyces sp. DSM 42041]|uniref:DUF732 domain-containing protein n=1 Tax=Streptomyces hazeniae TaxID=3075538 RepID=A0ABU2NRD5_9ACTN|nr:hypothetical protein [Streptomyces sp. DSM 42041]MDT0379543.1 hypothetical protein [Streptomyces sp. DSM 42041]
MRARTLRNAAAAVVLTAAVAVAGTGCGSGEDPAPDRGTTPGAASPSPDASAAGPGDGEPAPEKKEKGRAAEQPTVPKAELTPATGSFTGKQKEYLVDRVPEGYEPAAVLEAGQAACQRIGRTAKVDRKAAVGALRSGEIADAKDAVLHLCPKHKPLLQAAGLLD